MNYKLNYEGFEKFLIKETIDEDNIMPCAHYVFKFDNGYGASVIKHRGSYGHEDDLWELAVIRFDGDDWKICYTSEISDDVIGWQTDEDIRVLLERIQSL